MSDQPTLKPTGPNGQCCAKCLYAWRAPDGGLMCRRYPVGNSQRLAAPDLGALALVEKNPEPQAPQVETVVDHPFTVDYEWCGEYKRDADKMN